jgi:hypothetical protein
MFAVQAPNPCPIPKIPNWLIKSLVLVPLLLATFYGGIWLAAEPFCWHCFRHGGAITGWNEKCEVTEYWCSSCDRRWKPLVNLHRGTYLSQCGLMYLYY